MEAEEKRSLSLKLSWSGFTFTQNLPQRPYNFYEHWI